MPSGSPELSREYETQARVARLRKAARADAELAWPELAVSVMLHGRGGAVPIWVLGGVGAVGSLAGHWRKQMLLQLEGLAKAPICLQPLVLHCYKLLQEPL